MAVNLGQVYFAFGPDQSYYFDGPQCRKFQGVPDDWDIEDIKEMQSVKCIAMGSDGETFRVYEDQDNDTYSVIHGDFKASYPKLTEWLNSNPVGAAGCKVAFGPDDRFLAWRTNDGMSTRTIPDYEPADTIFEYMDTRLKLATFGVDWAYFYLQTDGRWEFDDMGYYTTLRETLEECQHGDVEFVAMNPYQVEEFFILLKNNTAIFRVPLAYRDDLEDALEQHGISCQALTSQRTNGSFRLPWKTKKSSFWKGMTQSILREVAGPVTGAVVSTVAASLVGSAVCTVM